MIVEGGRVWSPLWSLQVEGAPVKRERVADRTRKRAGPPPAVVAQVEVRTRLGLNLGYRLRDHLPRSGFRDRFIAKGRFERRMDEMPVKLITYPEPGLFGAAAAFAREHP